MCRLFAMSAGRRRARATLWLLESPDSLREQSCHNPDGTGLGYCDLGGMAHVRKQPLAAYDEDPGWCPIAPGELVRAGADLAVTSQLVIDRPPAHRLTLADLHPDARRSQRAATPGSATA